MLKALLKFFNGREAVSATKFHNSPDAPYTLKEVMDEFGTYEKGFKAAKVYEKDQKRNIGARAAMSDTPAAKPAPEPADKPANAEAKAEALRAALEAAAKAKAAKDED